MEAESSRDWNEIIRVNVIIECITTQGLKSILLEFEPWNAYATGSSVDREIRV